jgi:hypothetical protein
MGIVIMTIGCLVVISGLMLSLIIGLSLMLVMVCAGSALLLIGAYFDSKVRVRYQRTLPPVDQPIIVPSDFESILDYTYPKEADARTDDIEPFSTYEHLSSSYGNFWIKIGYLTKAFAKYLGLGLVLTIFFAAVQFLSTVDIIRGLLYWFVALVLMVPLFVLFLLWLLLNSYLFRDKAHLFPEGHRSIRGKRIGLILTYPLNYYGTNEFMNQFYIPSPSDLEDGGILRIHQLGLRFDGDFSDVYFRVHFISLFRYRVLMILWFGIGAVLMIWFLFFIFGPLILYFASLFGVVV